MAILDQFGKPIQQEILTEPQTAKFTNLPREYANHTSRGLTPIKLARLMDGAEQGNLIDQTNLYVDMVEKDAHIFSEMFVRQSSVVELRWSIEPPPNPSAEEKSQAAFLIEMFTDLPDWTVLLFDMLDGIGHGFSPIEIEWERLGKDWLPKHFHKRPQSWFQVAQSNQNELRLRSGTGLGDPLIPFGWIDHRHPAKAGVLSRSGLHRVLAWPYLFKNYATRDLAELLEVYGMPIKLGKYPPGSSEREKGTLLRAVTQLGHSAAGIIPEGMSIDFETAANGNHDPFVAMMEWAERSISKAILGNTLSTNVDGKTATNGLGKIHNKSQVFIQKADAGHLSRSLTRDVVYPLLALSGRAIQDRRRMPKVALKVLDEIDLEAQTRAIKTAVEAGIPVTVSHALNVLSYPARQNNEPILVLQSSPQAVAANSLQHPVAALTQQTLADPAPSPVDPLAAQMAKETEAAWQAVVAHIKELATSSASAEEFNAKLLTSYSSLPKADLIKIMTEGFMVAHLVGMQAVRDEAPGA